MSVISFGYRYGIPVEADMVVDVRFLDNPNFVPALKRFTGLDRGVRDYVLGARATKGSCAACRICCFSSSPSIERKGRRTSRWASAAPAAGIGPSRSREALGDHSEGRKRPSWSTATCRAPPCPPRG